MNQSTTYNIITYIMNQSTNIFSNNVSHNSINHGDEPINLPK